MHKAEVKKEFDIISKNQSLEIDYQLFNLTNFGAANIWDFSYFNNKSALLHFCNSDSRRRFSSNNHPYGLATRFI